MKPTLIRILTLTSFLIFMLPFMQMCSHYSMRYPEAEVAESAPRNSEIADKVALHDNREELESVSDAGRQSIFYTNESLNAYLLAYGFFDKPELSDAWTYVYLCYFFIMVLSVRMSVKAFKSKYSLVRKLALINIALLLLSVVLHYFSGLLEYWWQIKYGFYLFLINMLGMVFLVSSLLKEKTNNIYPPGADM